jgi:hypothetical protein
MFFIIGLFYPVVKWLEREADHSSPSSAAVKNAMPPLIHLPVMALNSLSTGTTLPLPWFM